MSNKTSIITCGDLKLIVESAEWVRTADPFRTSGYFYGAPAVNDTHVIPP